MITVSIPLQRQRTWINIKMRILIYFILCVIKKCLHLLRLGGKIKRIAMDSSLGTVLMILVNHFK